MRDLVFDVSEFGAVADGRTLCTEAFRRAVEACFAAGGGYVTVPAGAYVTGTVELKSGVYLRLEPGARLLGSTRIADYRGTRRGCPWGGALKRRMGALLNNDCKALIVAEDAENCGILGEGVVDGRRSFETDPDPAYGKPFLVVFSRCRNVKIESVTLQNPGMFTVYMTACEDVILTKLKIYSERTPCGDGLDFDGGRNVTISDCIVHAGDDAISLKTLDPAEPCENFTIQNCVLYSKYWGCVRIGPESTADMRHITVSNCVFVDSNDGFKVQLCGEAVYEDFCFSNISMSGVVRPFFFTNTAYSMSEKDPSIRPRRGIMRNIRVSNVTAEAAGRAVSPDPAAGLHLTGSYIYCLPERITEDLSFTDITLTVPGGGRPEENRRADHGEAVDWTEFYPEVCREMGEYPAAGFYVRNARRVSFERVTVKARRFDARPAVAAEAAEDLSLCGVKTVNMAYLLRQIACTGTEIFRCVGNEMPVPESVLRDWEENRRETEAFLTEARESAAWWDRAGRLPASDTFSETATFVPGESDGYVLFLPRCKGNVRIVLNGETVWQYRTPPKYRYETLHAADLTETVVRGRENRIRIVGEDGFELFEPARIVAVGQIQQKD